MVYLWFWTQFSAGLILDLIAKFSSAVGAPPSINVQSNSCFTICLLDGLRWIWTDFSRRSGKPGKSLWTLPESFRNKNTLVYCNQSQARPLLSTRGMPVCFDFHFFFSFFIHNPVSIDHMAERGSFQNRLAASPSWIFLILEIYSGVDFVISLSWCLKSQTNVLPNF